MKILRVGDPHVKNNNIDESDLLLQFVAEMALLHRVDRIELLGDLFHNHAAINLFVLEFWDHWLDHLSDICEVIVLVGNHDQSGDFNTGSHALSVFNRIKKRNLKIVDESRLEGIYGYISYTHNKDRFIELANSFREHGAKVLICHQTFQGSKYESGIYAPDGIEAELISIPLIISGHIHSRQRFKTSSNEVIYPGTARWTNSDANEQKGLWLVDHDENGQIVSEEFLDTSHVCTPVVSAQWKEGEDMPILKKGVKTTVELIGTSNWIASVKPQLKGLCSIKTKMTDSKKLDNREAGENLDYFLKNLFITSMDREGLLSWMKEMKIV